MMRFNLRFGFALLLASGLVSGCATKSPLNNQATSGSSGSSSDRAEVSRQLADNPDFVDDGVFESSDPTATGDAQAGTLESSSPGPAATLQRLRFWRRIAHVSRTFEFSFGDTDSTGRPTTAVVTVNKVLTGTFNIETVSRQDSIFQRSLVRKPLKDFWVRRILLHRARLGETGEPRWRIAGLSGVEVTSQDSTTRIRSLRLQTATFDTTVTDPLAFFRMRRVLRFDRDDSVTVTATTLRNDDVVVLQHRDRRVRFHNNGDNTYTGVFRAGFLARVHHVGVNALSNGTLYDDHAAYDSRAWILPYVVRPTELADADP